MADFVGIEVDLEEVEGALRGMAAEGQNLAPAFRQLRAPLQRDQREHARRQEGPDGKWAPRAARTLAALAADRRAGRPGRQRVLRKLPAAVAFAAGRTMVAAVSRVRWSAIHQEGGTDPRGHRLAADPFV
jgi:hypothetical protein